MTPEASTIPTSRFPWRTALSENVEDAISTRGKPTNCRFKYWTDSVRSMAKKQATKKERKKKSAASQRSSRYVCPQCGFRAAHAAGLGRHRSAIHGVVSKRQRAKSASARRTTTAGRRGSGDGQLTKRVAQLERRYDRLLTGLEQVLKLAKSRS